MDRLRVVRDDITRLEVDAIVNAANEYMLGGGGVDGAIHRAAGSALLEACRAFPEVRPGVRCPTGEVRLTPGFRLPARFVVHTVGPVWRGGHAGEDELLVTCYRRALELAAERGLESIAFPAISCGAYGFPIPRAAQLSVGVISRYLASHERPKSVLLVAFDGDVADAWTIACQAIGS